MTRLTSGEGRRNRVASKALAIIVLATLADFATAEAPLLSRAPRDSRAAVVARANGYRGTPYVYGGVDSTGFDCSGLVFRVFKDTMGVSLPRTARALFAYCDPIGRGDLQPGDLVFFNTTGGISHVGIYAGEDRFIHSTSGGSPTGVIESGLDEGYWSRTYAGAGRLIPPADYLGITIAASLGPSFGAYDLVRGVRGSIGASYRVFGIEAGIELRPAWDSSLEVLRVPAVLAIAIDRRVKAFVGPALTLGKPNLDGRAYEPSGGLLATAGVEYTMLRFRVARLSFCLAAELEYDRYIAAPGEATSVGLDAEARIRAGLGLGLRWGV